MVKICFICKKAPNCVPKELCVSRSRRNTSPSRSTSSPARGAAGLPALSRSGGCAWARRVVCIFIFLATDSIERLS